MKTPGSQRATDQIDALEVELAQQPWWASRKHADLNRRYHAIAMLGAIRTAHEYGQVDAEAVQRLLAKVAPVDARERVVVGQSVGYRLGRKLHWIDVPGATDSVGASKAAGTTSKALILKRTGFAEYGVTPMFDYQLPCQEPDRPLGSPSRGM